MPGGQLLAAPVGSASWACLVAGSVASRAYRAARVSDGLKRLTSMIRRLSIGARKSTDLQLVHGWLSVDRWMLELEKHHHRTGKDSFDLPSSTFHSTRGQHRAWKQVVSELKSDGLSNLNLTCGPRCDTSRFSDKLLHLQLPRHLAIVRLRKHHRR